MIRTRDFTGAHLPVPTPFTPDGELDLDGFKSNLRHWFEHDLQGILVAGSTGESVFLEQSEVRALGEAAREVLPDGARIITGAGVESTRGTITRARDAADAGADAVLIKPPVYFKGAMTPAALATHYKVVADGSPLPVIIYQVPLRLSTLEFTTDLITELSRHDNIVGIKDSRGDVNKLGEIVEACSLKFQVLVGAGALFYPAMEMGAQGGIMALGLMAPADIAAIWKAWTEERYEDCATIQERIAPVHNGIVGGMGVPGVKAALDLLGLHGGAPRLPLSPLDEERVGQAQALLAEAGLLRPTLV